MQLIHRSVVDTKLIWLASGLVCLMSSGCSQGSADAVAGSPLAGQNSSASASYELVLTTRPEQPELYFKHIQPFHELCAVAAQALKVPVKPFVAIPKDFIVERQTIATDGKNRLDKTEGFGLDGSDAALNAKTGCATDLLKSSVTQVTFNGKRQDITVASDGSSEASPTEVLIDGPTSKPQDLREYSLRKTVLGVPIRCLSAAHPVIASQTLLEACIYDGSGDATLLDEEGKPILVYSRQVAPVGNGGAANTLVTEPVKVSVGRPVDPGLFKFQGTQK